MKHRKGAVKIRNKLRALQAILKTCKSVPSFNLCQIKYSISGLIVEFLVTLPHVR